MKYSLTDKQIRNFMKLIVDQKTDIVLGVHLFGPDSAELIQLIGIAVKARLTKKQLDDTMAVHPTTAEELVTMRTPSRQIPSTQ
ncbi:MAG: glutathione reductase (NADPH) [Alphaproteobacteria bacterium]|jgi:glutathione reductase (NADPH)